MHFNPVPNKQANDVIFYQKSNTLSHPPLTSSRNYLTKYSYQEHLGIVLDSKLDFNIPIEQKIKNGNKIKGFMRRLAISVPRKPLLTIYKSFLRPHLDYGDILYDKPKNKNFKNKLEKIHYKTGLEITGAI